MQQLSWQESLSLKVASTRRRIKQLHAQKLRRFGLTPQQMGYLLCLKDMGPITLGGLAKRVGADDPTASRVISRLTDKGLVRTTTDREDRRCARIELSPQGRALVPKLETVAWSTEETLRAGITESELAAFGRVIEKVWNNIERASGEAPAKVPARASGVRR